MISRIYSYGICGLDAFAVTIEIDTSKGLPSTTIVGLPDNAVRESRERVRSAIRNSGFNYPTGRITINLSPADIKKEGPSFDLAIALGILAVSEQIPHELIDDCVILGELSLDGSVRPVMGALPVAIKTLQDKHRMIILPKNNAPEAVVCGDLNILPVRSLQHAIQSLQNPKYFTQNDCPNPTDSHDQPLLDYADVKAQTHVKRGLEIAAAGGHNCILIGPPGSGKTMMAKRLPSIMPDMSQEESLEVTKIHSIMGLIEPGSGLITQRPFRSPHHTSSDIALIGGGSHPRPGEVSLAHNGVLFLDELPEFKRNALEVLRQPLEDHYVTIARAQKTLRFPASFLFIASMNPSPSGYKAESTDSPYSVEKMHKYLSKISGPLLDRIDLHLEVSAVSSRHLIDVSPSEPSASIKKRTIAARNLQLKRFTKNHVFCNAKMTTRQVHTFCKLSNNCKELLKNAVEQLELSARAHDKILKISRTIADLDNKENIEEQHIAEAIQYRSLDRSWWQ